MKYVLLGFFSLITLSAFSSEEQTNNSVNNTTNSDNLTISVYSGYSEVGNKHLGGALGVGTELMYKNVSLGLERGTGKEKIPFNYTKKSIGIKIYNSGDNAKNKIFVGLNRAMITLNSKSGDIIGTSYDKTITLGYRRTISYGMYLSPYVGAELRDKFLNTGSPIFGLNVGYQFRPISLKK